MRHKQTLRTLYQQYQIPPNLQKHQMRVAYVLKTITDHWLDSSAINPEQIFLAGLFHDMGNLIKFNFADPNLLEGENPTHWQQIQAQFVAKYGQNVHRATLNICRLIGLNPSVINTIKLANWDDADRLMGDHNLPACLLIYADMRVGPYGIISYTQRINDLNRRSPSNQYPNRLKLAKLLESTIQPLTAQPLNQISDTDFELFSRKTLLYQISTV